MTRSTSFPFSLLCLGFFFPADDKSTLVEWCPTVSSKSFPFSSVLEAACTVWTWVVQPGPMCLFLLTYRCPIPRGGGHCSCMFSGTYFYNEHIEMPPGTELGDASEWHRLCLQMVLYMGHIFLPYKGRSYLKREHNWVSPTVWSCWPLGIWGFSLSPLPPCFSTVLLWPSNTADHLSNSQ